MGSGVITGLMTRSDKREATKKKNPICLAWKMEARGLKESRQLLGVQKDKDGFQNLLESAVLMIS